MKAISVFFKTVFIAASFVFATGIAGAKSVAVNFGGDGTNVVLKPDDKAGLPSIAQTNWNNAAQAHGSSTNLKDDSGTETTIDVEWHSGLGIWDSERADESGDAKMMRAYLDAGPLEESATVTFTGIPYKHYDVIVYFDGGDRDGRVGAYTVNGVTIYGRDSASFQGAYVECKETETWNAKAGNYVRFTALATSSVTVKAEGVSANDEYLRAAINGIQIVEVPGPESLATGESKADGKEQ